MTRHRLHDVGRSIHIAVMVMIGFALAGCDDWKQFDSAAGLLTTFNVDSVEIDGRQLIRMHSRRALVLIDPRGGRIVDYHLHDRTGAFYTGEKAKQTSRAERLARAYEARPNVLENAAWRTDTFAADPALDGERMWVVDAKMMVLELLSENFAGLRYRKAYEINDSGVLELHVTLENMRSQPVSLGADSVLTIGEPAEAGRYLEHYRVGEQWLSRQVVLGPDHGVMPAEATGPFHFPPRQVEGHGELSWLERWWITPAEGEFAEQPPASPPSE